jgi:hypothetical protein
MNKNTKIWLNYIAGAAISLFLLWSIWGQVTKQVYSISGDTWKHTGAQAWLWVSIALMLVNTSLESVKWYLLTNSVEPTPYTSAVGSYLAGVALSIITPNRIGEYPGRILYLGRTHTFRYINVAILGVVGQLYAVYIFGFFGLIYYNFAYPCLLAKAGLAACIVVNVFLFLVYWRFDLWLPLLAKIKPLARFAIYGRLLNRVTARKQFIVLGISLLRFAIFTAQYLFLLRWMNVQMPLAQGFIMAALFFWIMAVIPTIALTELGIRGSVSLFLFQHFSLNTVGMLAATAAIWLLNLIVPSVIGSILILRMKLLR